MNPQLAIQNLLRQKLADSRLKNSAYSLRAFSRKLGMSSSAVSEILSGKRLISRKLAERIVTRLALSPVEAHEIVALFPEKRLQAGALPSGELRKSLMLTNDQYHAISDWYHFAIVSLLETQGAKDDPAWISARLGITVSQASNALERLERLQMLKRVDGKLVATGEHFFSPDHVANLALRKTHAHNLELARHSLEVDEVDKRDFTAMTLAVDPDKLPEAKQMIRDFRSRFTSYFDAGAKKEVYKLCVQFIPLSRGDTR